MPKILPNRSSKTLAAAKLEAITGALQIILDNLNDLTAITDADYNTLAKLGEVLKPICDKVLEVVEAHPSYLEDEQPLAEVYKDKTYYEQLEGVRLLLKKIVMLIEREQGVCGAEYRNAVANYEENVKAKVKKGSSDAQLVLDKLNRINRGDKQSPPPPTAAAKAKT